MYWDQIDGFHTNEDGKTVTIMFARSREVPESMLVQKKEPGFEPGEVQQAFSTNNENPFAEFKPKLKQTGIFIDRFFHNWEYKDLAVKYEISEHSALGDGGNILKMAFGRIKWKI